MNEITSARSSVHKENYNGYKQFMSRTNSRVCTICSNVHASSLSIYCTDAFNLKLKYPEISVKTQTRKASIW